MATLLKPVLIVLLMLALVGCAATPPVPPVPAEATAAEAQVEASPSPAPAAETAAAAPASEALIELGETGMITYQTIELKSGTMLEYALLLPENFDPDRMYPILLALPPGPQTKEMVQWGLDNYWAREAVKRGWIVLSPVAPDGVLFFQGGEGVIPELLSRTAQLYQPEGGKYHVAGVSNGGISAFRVALNNVDKVQSVLAVPGFPRSDGDFQRLNSLVDIPVAMFVGEQDDGWVQQMEATEASLTELGGRVSLEVVAGEGHVIESLAGGGSLFDLLESFR